jgi:hypothetical protein
MQVYKTTNNINSKWYIGKDEASNPNYYGSGKGIKAAIAKYGIDNFSKEILEECNSSEELSNRERHWIEVTDAVKDKTSYNMVDGGTGGDRSTYINYITRGNQSDNFKGASKWYHALSGEERRRWHNYLGEKRCVGWYVSTLDNPDIEIYVKNMREWCDNHGVDNGYASQIANPKSKYYGKSAKGFRIRRSDGNMLPQYENRRGTVQNNKCKGRSWKLVDGIRVWYDK